MLTYASADKVTRARNASTISENSVGKAGWLMKQGQTVKSWKSRWFVLKEEAISYFRTADAQQPLGSIPCEGKCAHDYDHDTNVVQISSLSSRMMPSRASSKL